MYKSGPGPGIVQFLSQPETPEIDLSLELQEYPEVPMGAFHGITGQIVKRIAPETEADPIAILVQLLIAAGCAIGHRPHFMVGATKHFVNLCCCLVGRTSKGRKGTALDWVTRIMGETDFPWAKGCITSGLSSGEGLIYAVRDPLKKKEQVRKNGKYTDEVQEVTADFGVEDKRLLVIESEFSRSFKVMNRETNILSEIIRCSWDHGNLRSLVKTNPYSASDAHISILGHITREELRKSLSDDCSFFNGFANRFLWVCVQRSQLLPFGGSLDLEDLRPELDSFREAICLACGVEEVKRDEEGNEFWESIYPELSAEIPGKFGAAIGRAEGQVIRLAMLFALLDKSKWIRAVHLSVAQALWKYCVDSARHLFLSQLDDPNAQKVLLALRTNPGGMTRAEISSQVFQHHLSKSKIDEALAYLRGLNLADFASIETLGRPTERWFSIVKTESADQEPP